MLDDLFGDDELETPGQVVPASENMPQLALRPEMPTMTPVAHSVLGSDPIVALTDVGAHQLLSHHVTGELVEVEKCDGTPWRLQFHEGFGYITHPNKQSIWLNDGAFEVSFWRADNDLLVKRVSEDTGAEIVERLSEKKKKCNVSFASWKETPEYLGCGSWTLPRSIFLAVERRSS